MISVDLLPNCLGMDHAEDPSNRIGALGASNIVPTLEMMYCVVRLVKLGEAVNSRGVLRLYIPLIHRSLVTTV